MFEIAHAGDMCLKWRSREICVFKSDRIQNKNIGLKKYDDLKKMANANSNLHDLMNIIDNNSNNMNEQDYLQACNKLRDLYRDSQDRSNHGYNHYHNLNQHLTADNEQLRRELERAANGELGPMMINSVITLYEENRKWECPYCKKKYKKTYNKKRHIRVCPKKLLFDRQIATTKQRQKKLNKSINILRLKM